MKGFLRVGLLLGLMSCSNAGELADGVIEIQVIAPSPPVVDFGDTTQFIAMPLDANGDSVGAPVVWVTPDDSTITIVEPGHGPRHRGQAEFAGPGPGDPRFTDDRVLHPDDPGPAGFHRSSGRLGADRDRRRQLELSRCCRCSSRTTRRGQPRAIG